MFRFGSLYFSFCIKMKNPSTGSFNLRLTLSFRFVLLYEECIAELNKFYQASRVLLFNFDL